MKRYLYTLLLCLTFSSLPANAADWSLTNLGGLNTQSKNLEASYNKEERTQAVIFPLLESIIGCPLTQEVRAYPFGKNWFFTGDYECLKDSNRFNSSVYKMLNGPIHWLAVIFGALLSAVVVRKAIMTIIEVMITKTQTVEKKATIGYVLLITVVVLFLVPIYKSEENGKKDTNFMMMSIYTTFAATYQYGSYILHKLNGKSVIEQPYVTIPVPKNQRTREMLNLIDFQLCTKQQPGTRQGVVQFNYYEGHLKAFSQVGNCILEIEHAIDEGTIEVARSNGLPDLYQLQVEALTDAYTVAMASSDDAATKLSLYEPIPAGISAIEFDRDMSCDNVKTYAIATLDTSGVKQYAYAYANCIGAEFVHRLTRAPGVSEQSLVDAGSRLVQVCKTVTDSDDTEATQRACAAEMCSSESSPFMCSAQINNYNRLLGSRFMSDTNYATLPYWFMTKFYPSSKYQDAGKILVNSASIESTETQELVEPVLQGEPAFAIPFNKTATRVERNWSKAELMNAYEAESSLDLDVLSIITKYFTIGDGGILGNQYTLDCLNHPYGISPSGRQCSSPYKTLDIQANRLLAFSSEVMVMAKAASMLSVSPVEKAKSKAGVELASATMKQTAKMYGGTDAMVTFILASAVNASVSDVFSEYGQDFDPEAAYVIAAIYLNPEIASIASSTANYAWALGMYIKFGIPIAFALIVISFFMNSLIKITSTQIKIIPHFILLLGKQGVNKENDTWQPLETLLVTAASWATFGISIYLALVFIDALFVYQAIPFSVFSYILEESPNSSTLLSVMDQMFKICLYIFFLSFIIAAILKMAAYGLGAIIQRWAFGTQNNDVHDEQIESSRSI